jgi:hypothetical protein
MALNQAFTSFLSNTGDTAVRDYQHANRLYVANNYAKAPKLGFLYFITFSINTAVPLDAGWQKKEVGLLVKKIDLPKFNLKTEIVNQYNRKTIVQTGLTYTNINIEFHDDNSNLTRDLWTNYYRYYFMDSTYGTGDQNTLPTEFSDTKYNAPDRSYAYGLNSYQSTPFFDSINIYVLHQHNFTQYTLVNPMIDSWTHDSLDQDQGGKILANKMTVAYESVLYNKGEIKSGETPENFGAQYYDQTPGPLAVGGISTNGGTPGGASSVAGISPGPSQTRETPVNRTYNSTTYISKPQAQLDAISNYDDNNYGVLDGVLGNLQSAGAENITTIKRNNIAINPNSNITLPQYPTVQSNSIFKSPASTAALYGTSLPINPFSAVDDRITTQAIPSGINGSSTDDSNFNPDIGWSI